MINVRTAALAAAVIMMCAAASGCGEKKEDLPSAVSTPTAAETSAAAVTYAAETEAVSEETVTSAEKAEGHPILAELAASKVIASLYTEEEKGGSKEYREMLFTLFTDADGVPHGALISFSRSRKYCTILCGTYTAETSEDDYGTVWTNLDITDDVTGELHKIGFAEDEDPNGNYIGFILDEDGGDHRAKPISAADTVKYVKEALARENNEKYEKELNETSAPETTAETAEETTAAESETTAETTEETTETSPVTAAEETTAAVTETSAEETVTSVPETEAEETSAETEASEVSESTGESADETSADGEETSAETDETDEETTALRGAGLKLTVMRYPR